MSYPGDAKLDGKIQERILSAFAESVRLYQEGHPEECNTILRSILEVDPGFKPATRLRQAVDTGATVDLAQLLGEVSAAGAVDTDTPLSRAREALEARDFAAAAEACREVLRELPGHAEARRLLVDAQARARTADGVAAYLTRAREALAAGATDEAGELLALARSMDASHPGVAELEKAMAASGKKPEEGQEDFAFEVFDEPAPAELGDADGLFTVEPEPAPAPVSPPPATSGANGEPAPAADAGGEAGDVFAFDQAPEERGFAFDSGDTFDFAAGPEGGPEGGAAEPREKLFERVESLLDHGQVAFDAGDFQGAIDTWSRVYLIDTHNAEVDRRIEQARRRREEVERQADHTFYEAREAFDRGDAEQARALCQEVLRLLPQHLEAHDLLQRLETPAAPPPPPAALPPEEEEFFRDDFVPARVASSSIATPVGGGDRIPERGPARPAASRFRVPRIPGPALVAAAVVVVLVAAVLLLRPVLFPGRRAAAASALTEAEQLADTGRLSDAINVLRSLQSSEQLEGDTANQVSQRIVAYQRRLKRTATPVPKVSVAPIDKALADGDHLKAMRLVRNGLARVPGDPELVALRDRVGTYAAQIGPLVDAMSAQDYQKTRQLAGEVLAAHPGDAEMARVWSAATFDRAVVLLRKYQVAAAKSLLEEMRKRSEDAEVARLLDFATTYLARPVDPRYQIFVTNVELRPLE